MDTNREELAFSVLQEQSLPFLQFLEGWKADLPALPARKVFQNPKHAAVLSVDMTRGFCKSGALASPRVGALVPAVVELFKQAHRLGVPHFILSQDTHDPHAVEFGAWPAHCVRGTNEAKAVEEIQALPFYPQMIKLEKNSIDSMEQTGLKAWIQAHPEVNTYVVVGDCTDLCVYQLAMQLRTSANAAQLERRVIVPADCVETYDFPVEAAVKAGAMPHPGDLMHLMFLYHMALNGVEVVEKIYA